MAKKRYEVEKPTHEVMDAEIVVEAEPEVEAQAPVVFEEFEAIEEYYTPMCSVNVRRGPSARELVVYVLNPGDKVDIVKEVGEWYQIGDGAYVMKDFIVKH